MNDRTTANIGKILDDTFSKDAVHVAVAPVVAGADLEPGQHVGIVGYIEEPGKQRLPIVSATSGQPVGIIDPFLMENVQVGERCFVFLYPGSITSLRHIWSHPAFTPKSTNVTLVSGDSLPTFEKVVSDG